MNTLQKAKLKKTLRLLGLNALYILGRLLNVALLKTDNHANEELDRAFQCLIEEELCTPIRTLDIHSKPPEAMVH